MQIAGAMAERGCSLEEITKAAEQAAGNMGKGKCFREAGVELVEISNTLETRFTAQHCISFCRYYGCEFVSMQCTWFQAFIPP